MSPHFSVIVLHCSEGTPSAALGQCFSSIAEQSWEDFQVELFIRGPAPRELGRLPLPRARIIARRATDASLEVNAMRDAAINMAGGEWIVLMRSDEVFASTSALTRLAETTCTLTSDEAGIALDFLLDQIRHSPKPDADGGWASAMQFVTRRRTWIERGGWYARADEEVVRMLHVAAAIRGVRREAWVIGSRVSA